jgi:hypothetical protein
MKTTIHANDLIISPETEFEKDWLRDFQRGEVFHENSDVDYLGLKVTQKTESLISEIIPQNKYALFNKFWQGNHHLNCSESVALTIYNAAIKDAADWLESKEAGIIAAPSSGRELRLHLLKKAGITIVNWKKA